MGYSAQQIYAFARSAGFSPSQAVTMTAIALAESGGNSTALNTDGENSQGLWQINRDAHGWALAMDMTNPHQNAEAAFRVSRGGADISPWTVTHGGENARYLRYREKAQAAAVAAGDGAGLGMWTGVSGYGDVTSAGAGGGEAYQPGAGSAAGGESKVQTFLQAALAQSGDEYVFGAETRPGDPDPDEWDCSELTGWAAAKAGVTLPEGSWEQYLDLKAKGALIPVEQAAQTPGALLFYFDTEPVPGGGRPGKAHVAISLGNGKTIEARSPSDGVGSWDIGDRFTYAAVIPGLSGSSDVDLAALGTLNGDGTDTDKDELTDALETKLGLNPASVDSDHDNLSDQYELLVTKTDAASADSDRDGVRDGVELNLKLNPLKADSDLDGTPDALPGAPVDRTDSDDDRLTDALEKILGTNPLSADSDGDGFGDGLEHRSGFGVLDPFSNPLVPANAGAAPGADPMTAGAPARTGLGANADVDDAS